MSGSATSSLALSEEQQQQLEAISAELEPLRAAGAPKKARSSLDSILSNVPEAEDYQLLRAALLALRADVHLDLDEPARALEDAEAAVEAGWQKSETYDAAGWANYGLDRPEAARDQFDRALELDPDRVSSLMGRALALVDVDEFDHARSDLTHAINIEGNDAELYALRGDAFIRMGKFDQAERDLIQAREIDPEESDYALQLARLMMVQGRADDAANVIDKAIEGDDTALEALLLRSHIHLLGGRNTQARADAIRASNNFPDEAFAFVQLAHVQLAAGQGNMALKAAERAVELDPSLSDAYMVRGAALHMRGDTKQAQEDFERAHQAPAELPMFLLGPCYSALEATGFQTSMRDMLNRYSEAVSGESAGEGGQTGAHPPFGSFDPMSLLGQVFDDSGKMKGRFKPFLEMAMKNAPNILKNVPPSLLKNVGGLDPSQLEDIDLSELSSDQIEEQMRQFYEMMQSGENPFEGMNGNQPSSDGDDDDPDGDV
ncbi:tetratricopeptide repeat protein [Persicimonas caeni]|uniref:Tetratricopeptide repeat protein n=1 Tax=Persicimonas caeni TaxID=2292766 RepID=A0A4Y6PT75_PERCE|nr:tetratricopeptide repeat protein [Persicimonas caeni]QDG51522.1 tetratricopeptide repeat protein [Persicimonas caeni]QED32743.1 tetratricopeptide repeat protein [Persicimonas caeni]